MIKRMRAGSVSKLILLGVLSPSHAFGQSVPDIVVQLRNEYDNCVYSSVGVQWKAAPNIDPNVAAETAFLACLTEERGIRAALAIGRLPSEQTEAGIAGVKLRLKRNIREIMTDPKGYLQRNR